MKINFFNTFLMFFLLVVLFTTCSKDEDSPTENDPTPPTGNNDTLPNQHFENWSTYTQGNVSFEEPASGWWASLNTLKFLGGPATCEKTSQAHDGLYALRLETKLWGDEFIIPGLLAAGYFDINAPIGQNLIQGQPFTYRPQKLEGFYMYTPQNNDSAIIYSNLTKYNTASQLTDTIAELFLLEKNEISTYQKFSVSYTYFSNQTPDTINIVLTSSGGGKEMAGQDGSLLIIDDLSLVF